MISGLKRELMRFKHCISFLRHHRSSYRYWVNHDKKMSPKRLKQVTEVKSISNECGGSSSITIATIATERGVTLSRDRASRLMKQYQIVSCQLPKHAYKKATQEHLSIPTHLNRQFTLSRPNEVWCGDVTHIWAGNRCAYLTIVTDLFARKPIGWAISYSPNSQ
jgi:putative transposase